MIRRLAALLVLWPTVAFGQTQVIGVPNPIAPNVQFTPTVTPAAQPTDYMKVVRDAVHGMGVTSGNWYGQPLTSPTELTSSTNTYEVWLFHNNNVTAKVALNVGGSGGGGSGGGGPPPSNTTCPSGQVVISVSPFACTPLLPGPKGDKGDPGTPGAQGNPGPAAMGYCTTRPKFADPGALGESCYDDTGIHVWRQNPAPGWYFEPVTWQREPQ